MDTSGVTTPCINHFNRWTELTPEISQAGNQGTNLGWSCDEEHGHKIQIKVDPSSACQWVQRALKLYSSLGEGLLEDRNYVLFLMNQYIKMNGCCNLYLFGIEIAGFTNFVADVCSKRKLTDWSLFHLNHICGGMPWHRFKAHLWTLWTFKNCQPIFSNIA